MLTDYIYTSIFVLFQMSYLVFILIVFKPQNKKNNFKIKTFSSTKKCCFLQQKIDNDN